MSQVPWWINGSVRKDGQFWAWHQGCFDQKFHAFIKLQISFASFRYFFQDIQRWRMAFPKLSLSLQAFDWEFWEWPNWSLDSDWGTSVCYAFYLCFYGQPFWAISLFCKGILPYPHPYHLYSWRRIWYLQPSNLHFRIFLRDGPIPSLLSAFISPVRLALHQPSFRL